MLSVFYIKPAHTDTLTHSLIKHCGCLFGRLNEIIAFETKRAALLFHARAHFFRLLCSSLSFSASCCPSSHSVRVFSVSPHVGAGNVGVWQKVV